MAEYLYLLAYEGERHEDCIVQGLYDLKGLYDTLFEEINGVNSGGSYYIYKMRKNQNWFKINQMDCNCDFIWNLNDGEDTKEDVIKRLQWTIQQLDKLQEGKCVPDYEDSKPATVVEDVNNKSLFHLDFEKYLSKL